MTDWTEQQALPLSVRLAYQERERGNDILDPTFTAFAVIEVWETCKAKLDILEAELSALRSEREWRPLDVYHEDHGAVLWWTKPVSEPPWVGTPNDDDWRGYHFWWTPLPSLLPGQGGIDDR